MYGAESQEAVACKLPNAMFETIVIFRQEKRKQLQCHVLYNVMNRIIYLVSVFGLTESLKSLYLPIEEGIFMADGQAR